MNETKKDVKKEEQKKIFIPSLYISPNKGSMNREYIRIVDTLYELAEILNLTKYTYEQIQATPGVYIFDGMKYGYCTHEIVLKLLSHLSTKKDITHLDEKLDKILEIINK